MPGAAFPTITLKAIKSSCHDKEDFALGLSLDIQGKTGRKIPVREKKYCWEGFDKKEFIQKSRTK